jgi:methionyl-tRNA formyltransferase
MEKIKVSFIGGKQAGCVGLLSLYAADCSVISVVAYDELVEMLAEKLNLPFFSSIKEEGFIDSVSGSDLLVSVHGREMVPPEMLKKPSRGCINVHPCLYKYKGSNPVERLLKDNNTRASVGVHYMVEKVDSGEVIVEKFVDVSGENTVSGIYNRLYPYYALAILEAIDKIRSEVPSL